VIRLDRLASPRAHCWRGLNLAPMGDRGKAGDRDGENELPRDHSAFLSLTPRLLNQEPLTKLHVISQVLLRRRKCSRQSPLWLSVRFSRSRQWSLSLRRVTARGPVLIHIRPSSAPGTRATRARIVRARARSGCAIITAARSRGRLESALEGSIDTRRPNLDRPDGRRAN